MSQKPPSGLAERLRGSISAVPSSDVMRASRHPGTSPHSARLFCAQQPPRPEPAAFYKKVERARMQALSPCVARPQKVAGPMKEALAQKVSNPSHHAASTC